MNDDITLNPDINSARGQELQHQELFKEKEAPAQAAQQVQMQSAAGVQCPHCGTINDPMAMFCASCGEPIGMTTCPNCGAAIDADADFCESCHHYIRKDICSFCGARLSGAEAFCPECGSPRGGIVCPTCHTLNDFSFCKQCGTALTEEARHLVAEIQKTPEYLEMQKVAEELQRLELVRPFTSEEEKKLEQANQQLRERVLKLLAEDRGVVNPVIEKKPTTRINKEELAVKKEHQMSKLTELLDKMALKPQPQPAKARNYAMACKPQGVRLAWECNYKHALHSSPCGCAKPQLGGKWLILGKNTKQEIKDDK
ncbi:MAG: zinc ribbon domain-containing protein [Prevotella sp.]|nr:zinc ribbon domain-containing protein [Prevotella sp.]